MRFTFSLLLLPAVFLAGCAMPEDTLATVTIREGSWDPIPDYYVWDGYEYVGFYGSGYYYLGPGDYWLALDVHRIERFRSWCAAHPDWRRHAVPNEHHRRGRDGNIHRPRPDRNRTHPGDWREPGLHHPVPPPPAREPDRPGDRRKEDRHGDRPQGHHPPSPVVPPAPPRTGPETPATRPQQALPPHKDRTKADRDKHAHNPKKPASAPRTGPKAQPPGPPRMTPPPPPSLTPPPPPSIKPSAPPTAKPPAPKPPAPPKVNPPRQSDKPADKADDKDGDRRKPR